MQSGRWLSVFWRKICLQLQGIYREDGGSRFLQNAGVYLPNCMASLNREMCALCRCLPMSEYEELQLLNQLRRVPSMGDVPAAVRRLYRKLCVRRLKRERGMPLFNLDDVWPGRRAREVTQPVHRLAGDVRILDRFQVTHGTCQHCYRCVNFIRMRWAGLVACMGNFGGET
jgi:hypothetical protein